MPPVREVIEPGENGLVEPLFDIERLTETALRVLADPAANSPHLAAARRTIEEKYSLESCIPPLTAFFERVASDKALKRKGRPIMEATGVRSTDPLAVMPLLHPLHAFEMKRPWLITAPPPSGPPRRRAAARTPYPATASRGPARCRRIGPLRDRPRGSTPSGGPCPSACRPAP